jgi:hypothetical protein
VWKEKGRKKEGKKERTLAFQADSSGELRVARLKSSRKARSVCRGIGGVVGGRKVKRGKEESQRCGDEFKKEEEAIQAAEGASSFLKVVAE